METFKHIDTTEVTEKEEEINEVIADTQDKLQGTKEAIEQGIKENISIPGMEINWNKGKGTVDFYVKQYIGAGNAPTTRSRQYDISFKKGERGRVVITIKEVNSKEDAKIFTYKDQKDIKQNLFNDISSTLTAGTKNLQKTIPSNFHTMEGKITEKADIFAGLIEEHLRTPNKNTQSIEQKDDTYIIPITRNGKKYPPIHITNDLTTIEKYITDIGDINIILNNKHKWSGDRGSRDILNDFCKVCREQLPPNLRDDVNKNNPHDKYKYFYPKFAKVFATID